MERTVIQQSASPARMANFGEQIRGASRDREHQSPDIPQIAAADLTGPQPDRRISFNRGPDAHRDCSRRCLVLGGGRAAGNAWAIGVIAGVAEAGLDMTEAADVVIGTSSGAIAAVQCAAACRRPKFSPRCSPPRFNRADGPERPPALPVATVFERMRAISAAATSTADLQRAMGAFGLECDSIWTHGRQHRAVVAPGCRVMNGRPGRSSWSPSKRIPEIWPLSTAIPASTWSTRLPRHRAAGLVPHNQYQRHSLHQRRRALR